MVERELLKAVDTVIILELTTGVLPEEEIKLPNTCEFELGVILDGNFIISV